jgi:hypothetical protein
MTYLADLLGGKSETDLEKAVDRFFLNRAIVSVSERFFDPNRRKRELEEKLLSRYLDDDTAFKDKASFLTEAIAYGKKPAMSIAQALLK